MVFKSILAIVLLVSTISVSVYHFHIKVEDKPEEVPRELIKQNTTILLSVNATDNSTETKTCDESWESIVLSDGNGF